jgi:hypothetical protein
MSGYFGDAPTVETLRAQEALKAMFKRAKAAEARVSELEELIKYLTSPPHEMTERVEWKPECRSFYMYGQDGTLLGSDHPVSAVVSSIKLRLRVGVLEQQNAKLCRIWRADHIYIQLLEKELSDVMPLASLHGFTSKRADEGTAARIAINQAIAELGTGNPST